MYSQWPVVCGRTKGTFLQTPRGSDDNLLSLRIIMPCLLGAGSAHGPEQLLRWGVRIIKFTAGMVLLQCYGYPDTLQYTLVNSQMCRILILHKQ